MDIHLIHSNRDLKTRRRELRRNATPQEVILWRYLRRSNLGFKFERQHGIGGYIVDFYCYQRKVAVEIDGAQHSDENAKKYDQLRTKYLKDLGFRVLRFWNSEIDRNLEGVLLKIKRELDAEHPASMTQHPS